LDKDIGIIVVVVDPKPLVVERLGAPLTTDFAIDDVLS